MHTALRILIVEDLEDDAELMTRQLQLEGLAVHWQRVDTEEAFLQALKNPPDVILADWAIPGFSGLRALELMNEQALRIPFIIVSGNIGEEAAFSAVRLGAYDYVLKDRIKRLGPAVQHALEQKKMEDERERAEKTERALFRSEQYLHQIFDNASVGMVMVGLDRKFIQVNPAFCKLIGYPALELTQMTVEQVTAPEDLEATRKIITSLASGAAESLNVDKQYIRKDGTRVWAHTTASLVHDHDGQPLNLVAVIEDITERKRTERLLRESEERYRELVNRSPNGILVLQNGRYCFTNPAGARLLGYREDEVIGLSAFKTIHPDSQPLVEQRLRNLASGCSNPPAEMKIVHKDGSTITTESVSVPVTFDNEPAVLILSNDITSRRRAEETVRLQNLLLTAIRDAQAQYIAGKNEQEVFQSLVNIIVTATGSAAGRLDEVMMQPDGSYRLELLGQTGEEIAQESLFPIPLHYGGELVGLAGLANRPGGYSEELTGQFDLFMTTCASIIAACRKDRAEQAALSALRESEGKFRQLAESINETFFLLDRESLDFLYASPMFEVTWGRKVEDLLQNPDLILETFHPEDIGKIRGTIATLRETFEATQHQIRILRPGGEVRWLRVRIFPVYDDHSRATRYAGIVEDITERRTIEEALRVRTAELEILFLLSKELRQVNTTEEILELTLQELKRAVPSDAELVVLLDPDPAYYSIPYANGLLKANQGIRCPAHEGLWPRILKSRQTLQLENYAHEPDRNSYFEGGENIGPAVIIPLQSEVEIFGALAMGRVLSAQALPFTPAEVHLLNAVSEMVANAIRRVRLFDDLRDANDQAIEGWSQAMDLRDRETEGHSLRVTEMTLRVAQRMGIQGPELVHVRRGALLHDMGKLGIPDEILLKPGKLDEREWQIMRQHPGLALELLSKIKFLQPALEIPYCHHERWDGSGYPRGLQGDQIPLAARIFAVCDVWDALINDRPYRPAWKRQEAFAYIRQQANQQFDPFVVEAFVQEILTGEYLEDDRLK